MSLIRLRDLVGLAAAFGMLGYLATRYWYLQLPSLRWIPAATVVVLVVFEFALAGRLRAVIGHDPDARPVPAVAVARWVALGRASAIAGSVTAGLAGGYSGYVLSQFARLPATGDLVSGLLLTVACTGLAVAGVVLERSGVAPDPPD